MQFNKYIHTYIHKYVHYIHTYIDTVAGRPGSSEVHRHPLTRWDASSIPANGIFLTKKLKNENKNAQRVENDEIVSTQKFDFTVDEGKERLNTSREKN